MTFDLLWTLFPPNTLVYTSCVYSEEPKCLVFDFGEEKILKKGKFYVLQCRYLDFNGKVLGEVISNLLIPEFRGAKPITSLEAFPLKYHQEMVKVRSELIERGRRFASLSGIHHTAYQGLAHQKRKGEPFKFSVKGRIMVDPIAFKEHNPNYERPRVDGLSGRDILGIRTDVLHDILAEGLGLTDDIKNTGDKNKTGEMKDEEYLVCGPTVLGFSLDRRAWGKVSRSLFTLLGTDFDICEAMLTLIEQRNSLSLGYKISHGPPYLLTRLSFQPRQKKCCKHSCITKHPTQISLLLTIS